MVGACDQTGSEGVSRAALRCWMLLKTQAARVSFLATITSSNVRTFRCAVIRNCGSVVLGTFSHPRRF